MRLASTLRFEFAACFLELGRGVESGNAAGRCGGLTASNAGLSGSVLSGLGVDGVEFDVHLVPNT